MPITQAHDRYMRILLDRIQESKYPSGELMDRVEILLDREHADDYLEILFEKVEGGSVPQQAATGQDRPVDPQRLLG